MLKSVPNRILSQVKGINATRYEDTQSFLLRRICETPRWVNFGKKIIFMAQKRSLFNFSMGLKKVLKISTLVLQNWSFRKEIRPSSARLRRALGGL